MIRSALWFALVLGSIAASPIHAAEVTLAYKGVVTGATGPQASSFVPGQTIRFSYELDTEVPDSDPTSSSGFYAGALLKLTVEIPAVGLSAVSGSSSAQVGNNIGPFPFDIFTLQSLGLVPGSSIGGNALTGMTLGFFDMRAEMLVSDALPISHLVAPNSFVSLRLGNDTTTVSFLAEPDLPVATCAAEGYAGTKLLWCQNICEKGYTGLTLDAWRHRWVERYRTLPACAL